MEVTKCYDLIIRRETETENLEVEVKYEYFTSKGRSSFIWLHIIEKRGEERWFLDRLMPDAVDDQMYNFIEPTYENEWVATAVTPELRDLIFKLIDEVKEEAKGLIPAFEELI